MYKLSSGEQWTWTHLVLLQPCLLFLTRPDVATCQSMKHYCRYTLSHTLCSTTGTGQACRGSVLARGVSEEAGIIISHHNKYRMKVAMGQEERGDPGPQPMASNMREVVWDEELALVAQRHADQCIFESDCDDCRKVERFDVGQNAYVAASTQNDTAANWAKVIKFWYDNVADVPRSMYDHYTTLKSTSSYTQLVWAKTHKIGCGFMMFKDGKWFKKFYVCNYGPMGNIMPKEIYINGRPCSACPGGTACSLMYPGLCGVWTPMSRGTPVAAAATMAWVTALSCVALIWSC